jgi:thiol-disulfide isomerase/thioredoxin
VTRERAVIVEGVARVGRPAPRVELPRLGGGRVRLAELRGRPAVINFWASRCPPCVAEMPDFERVHRRLAGRVAFLGVAVLNQHRNRCGGYGYTPDLEGSPSGDSLMEGGRL